MFTEKRKKTSFIVEVTVKKDSDNIKWNIKLRRKKHKQIIKLADKHTSLTKGLDGENALPQT